MPPDVALRTYRMNKEFYDPILKKADPAKTLKEIKASVILISGCQDNQYSSEGDFNGLFTGTMLRVWNQGKFSGSHRKFHKTIVHLMTPEQTPNYFRAGAATRLLQHRNPLRSIGHTWSFG